MDAILDIAAGFGCCSVAPSMLILMPAVCTVVGKRYTLHGPCELCVGFHHKTKAKVEKQANITSFPQQDILVFQEGMAGAKFTSYARTIRSRT